MVSEYQSLHLGEKKDWGQAQTGSGSHLELVVLALAGRDVGQSETVFELQKVGWVVGELVPRIVLQWFHPPGEHYQDHLHHLLHQPEASDRGLELPPVRPEQKLDGRRFVVV